MSIPQQCQHIFVGGKRCGGIAERGEPLCRHHLHRRALAQTNRARRHSVALPPLEDRAAIQMSIDEILASFAARKISRREAGTYLFAIHIASINLARIEQFTRQPQNEGCPGPPAAHPEEQAPETASPAPGATVVGPALRPGVEPPEPEPLHEAESQDHVPGRLLDNPDAAGTHEHDLERPLPLTPKKARQRSSHLEDCLRGYRQAHAFYAAMPQDDPNHRPPVVLAYLEKNIAKTEAELRALHQQAIPDSP